MLKRKWVSVALVMASAVLMTGCAAEKKEETSATENGVKELEFFQMKVEAVDHFGELISKFEEQHPDIKIVQNTVPDAETVLMTRMASDQVPDLFTHYPLDPTFREQVKEGYILDISDLKGLKNVRSDILEMEQLDGKIYALPMTLSIMGMYYNEAIFEKAGVEIPQNVEELYDVCEKLKTAGVIPMVFPDKDSWTVKQFVDSLSTTFLEDPETTFQNIAQDKVTNEEKEQILQMGQLMVKLHEYAQPDFLGTGYEQAITEFANENAAMFYQGIWAYPEIKKANPDMKIAMFPLIGGEFDNIGINIDCAVAVSASTKYPEEARMFLDFLAEQENAQFFSDADGTPSVMNETAYNAPGFLDTYQMVLDGKGESLASNQWPANFGGQYAGICQKLISSGDVNTWYQELEGLIKDTYNK